MNVFLHSSRLKNSALIIALFLIGCQTDLLIPCDGPEILSGEICREFVEVDNNPVGTVEYSYDSVNRIRTRTFRSTDDAAEKTLTYSYSDNLLVSISEEVNGAITETAYGYNEMDSLISVAYFSEGQIDSIRFIDRIGEKRERERLEVNGAMQSSKEYRYRQSDGILDRVSFYDSANDLLFYHRFEFFQDGSERIELRTTDHILVFKTVIRRNDSGHLTLVEVKDPQDGPLRTTNFIYDAEGRIINTEFVSEAESRKTTYLYY